MAARSAPGCLAWPLCGPPIQEGWVSWGLRTSLRHRLKDACSTGFCPGRCPALRDLLLEWLLEFGGAEPKPCAIAYFPESWDLRGGRQRRGRQTYDSVVTALDVGLTGTLVGRTVGAREEGGRQAGGEGWSKPQDVLRSLTGVWTAGFQSLKNQVDITPSGNVTGVADSENSPRHCKLWEHRPHCVRKRQGSVFRWPLAPVDPPTRSSQRSRGPHLREGSAAPRYRCA